MASRLTALEPQKSRNLVREAFEVLNYNQQLVQFADSKAATLILINSLFVAAAGAAEVPGEWGRILQILYVVTAGAAIFFCLSVVVTRAEPTGQTARSDLIFFDEILKRRNAGHYAAEFRQTPEEVHADDLMRRIYVVASIAKRKFAAYTVAQNVTALAGVLWLASTLWNLLTR